MKTEALSKPGLLPVKRAFVLHVLGMPASFLLTGYFSNFHEGFVPFLLLGLFFQTMCGTVNFTILGDVSLGRILRREDRLSMLVLIVAGLMAVASIVVSLQFPGLFERRIILMDAPLPAVFSGLMFLSSPTVLWIAGLTQTGRFSRFFESAAVVRWARMNRAGIVLATLFFFVYFCFAQSLNFPGYYTRDQYFEMDISDWADRLTDPPVEEILPVRAVHPAVLLFLRPLIWLASVPLNGDKLQAAFALSALAGAGCVFMTWLVVRQRTGNTSYALITASLLGASASHLLLSSMLETYIFSALALIAFCFLLQSGRTSLKSTIPMGVVIFGITVTNLAQACLLYFLKLPRLKVMSAFVSGVVLIVLALNVAQVQLFPFARPLYDPSNLLAERKYGSNLFKTRQWRGRVNLIARSLLLYGVISPDPYVLTEELGTHVPNFRTFKITAGEVQVAGYKGFSDLAAKTWIVILGAAILLFAFDLFRRPKSMGYPVSLALCMGFSFGLHILYGDDPMLYSPNWVYALILFISASFERWADNKWLQLVFIVFLGMMIYTNLGLIQQIMSASLPYYGR